MISSNSKTNNIIKEHELFSFFLLVFVASWMLGLLLYIVLRITEVPARVDQAGALPLVILFLAEAFASIGGIAMTLSVSGKAGLKEMWARLKMWKKGISWYLIVILTNPLAALIVLLVLSAFVSPIFVPAIVKGENVSAMIPFVIFFGLATGVLEEFGWTDFALPRLLKKYSFFTSTFWLGVIWALWHALLILWVWPSVPADNFLLQAGGGFIWMAALVPYRILMSWVYVNTNSSLFLAILMHAFYDASLAFLVPQVLSTSPINNILFFTGLNVVLWIFVILALKTFPIRR